MQPLPHFFQMGHITHETNRPSGKSVTGTSITVDLKPPPDEIWIILCGDLNFTHENGTALNLYCVSPFRTGAPMQLLYKLNPTSGVNYGFPPTTASDINPNLPFFVLKYPDYLSMRGNTSVSENIIMIYDFLVWKFKVAGEF